MGDSLLPLDYPEMLGVSFSKMFEKMPCMFNVGVKLGKDNSIHHIDGVDCSIHDIEGVYGKITPFIRLRDEHSKCSSAHFRVGSLLFNRTEGTACQPNLQGLLELERSVVTVPSGNWLLSVKVDLQAKTRYTNQTHLLQHTFDFETSRDSSKSAPLNGTSIKVEVNIALAGERSQQLGRPVEVVNGNPGGHPTVVYTIGDDAMSFIEFIATLRRILAYHPYREDILDSHDLLNLSCTREHPVLPKRLSGPPRRWLHIELRAVEGRKTSWTTLLMRDDNMYVHGFMNQQGVSYELLGKGCTHMIPGCYNPQPLYWDIRYANILRAKSNDEVVRKLKRAELGRNFAKKAVVKLSRYSSIRNPGEDDDDDDEGARLALAGLIIMICESARMNPLNDSFARGWTTGTGFTEQLMRDYVWGYYGDMSAKLLEWKSEQYAEPEVLPRPIEHLQNIYLVLNNPSRRPQQKGKRNNHQPSWKHGDHGGNNGDPPPDNNKSMKGNYPRSGSTSEPKRTGDDRSCGRSRGRGRDVGRYNRQHKRDRNEDNNEALQLQRQPKKADNTDRGGGPAIKSKEAGNTAGGSGGPASSKPGEVGNGGGSQQGERETGDARSGGGDGASASQPGDSGDIMDPSGGGNSYSQPRNADGGTHGHGRPRVELLAIRADLGVVDTTITIFDGKRGQIVYMHKAKEHGEEQGRIMGDLVLTGPHIGISASGCFAIKIDILDAAAGSSSGDAGGGLIEWEWDGYDEEFAAEVDKPPVKRTISPSAPGRNVEVTYAVMSDALEATVEVMLQLKDGHNLGDNNGKITALIDGFDVQSVLFSRTKVTAECFSRDVNDSRLLLTLDRKVVAVPCGKALHIGVDITIPQTSKGFDDLVFENGCCTKSCEDGDGNKVEVNITWYPEVDTEQVIAQPTKQTGQEAIGVPKFILPESSHRAEITLQPGHPPKKIKKETDDEQKLGTAPLDPSHSAKVRMEYVEVVYTIRDELSFISFMLELRRILADHPHHEEIWDCQKDPNLSSIKEYPLLAQQHAEQPARWVHIKLEEEESEEKASTTLLMRDDNLYVCGFMNRQGVWYEILDKDDNNMLPKEYNPKRLQWGIKYRTILDALDNTFAVDILGYYRLNKTFAVGAVHALSRFPDYWEVGINPRMALAGLIVMVCECARMKPLQESFVLGWTRQCLMKDRYELIEYLWKYGTMSNDLCKWKSRNYDKPYCFDQLRSIYLVLNSRLPDLKAHHYGRPRVELLAIRADFSVIGTKIMVFDGKRGQIIYMKREQGEQGMVDLALSGPNTGISAHGRFTIKIDIPTAATVGSSNADSSGPINMKWDCDGDYTVSSSTGGDSIGYEELEWDCYKKEHADEVDKSEPVTHTIRSLGPYRPVQVIYAVMSNAREATVRVKLWLKDEHSPCVHGKITARIGNFKEEIVLFRNVQGTGQRFSPTRSRMLQLARPLVMVPCGWALHIKVDLQIECPNNNQRAKYLNVSHSFDNNDETSLGKRYKSDEVEVYVTWYPERTCPFPSPKHLIEMMTRRWQPDISYTIGEGGDGFSGFITDLCWLFADHPHCKQDILDHHPDPAAVSLRNHHPVLLRKADPRTQDMWLHIKLEAVGDHQETTTASTTLLVHRGKAYLMGFKNQNGNWYMLHKNAEKNLRPPVEDGPKYPDLSKEHNCKTILKVDQKGIVQRLNSERLGMAFAARAVRMLSRYDPDVGADDEAKMALAGLSVIVCESARMYPLQETFADGWKDGVGFTNKLMDYILNWRRISKALLDWKDHCYHGWTEDEKLDRIGIKTAEDALDIVHLVRDVPIGWRSGERSP